MRTSDFDYDLPPALIAQEPLPERADARMLVVHRASGELDHRHVRDLPDCLAPGDVLVLNDTRVFPARIFGSRTDTGGRVEVLLLEGVADAPPLPGRTTEGPDEGPPALAKRDAVWRALCKSRGRLHAGTVLSLANGKLMATILGTDPDATLRIRIRAEREIGCVLDEEGSMPVPPYIKRARQDRRLAELDRQRYQTVYAAQPGAVAAPTAGLHLSRELLQAAERRGIRVAAVTLHVGLGTFRPVRADNIEAHEMDAERYVVGADAAATIRECQSAGGRVVAVGTTTARALETVAAERGQIVPCSGETRLFVRPPFEFRCVRAMLTNFHLPRSTLLMMVTAFASQRLDGQIGQTQGLEGALQKIAKGRELILHAYAEAVEARYRFYSYGDCMLLA